MLQRTQCNYWPLATLLAVMLAGCGLSTKSEGDYLKKGRALLAANDGARAILEFKNALKVAPQDAEPYYEIGQAYLRSGDYGSAVASFRRCLELNPRHEAAKLKTAELMASSRQPETLSQAAAQLREVLEASPQNTDAADALAITEWRLGNRDEAIARLQKLLGEFPANLPSSLLLARMKLSQNDLPAAEEALRSAVNSTPQSPEAALALGEMYLATGQSSKAEVELRRAVQLNPKNGQALLALAAIQTSARRWDEAEETYRRLSALGDKQYKPLHALFLFQRGTPERALVELRELARLDPADRSARTRLIAGLLTTGHTAEAETLLADALRRNSKDTDALMQRSALFMRAGKTYDAKRDLQQVLMYQPENADAHQAIARTHKRLGQLQSERRELIDALRLRRELLAARLALARNYINGNEPKAALQILDETPVSQQKLLPVLVERNWALLATNDFATLRTALSAELPAGRYPELVLQQALLQLNNREYAAARGNADEVLKSDPQDVRAARIVVESYVAQNQRARALDELAKLAKAAPGSAPLQHMLGVGLAAGGDLVQARVQFEAALRADRDFTSAAIAVADLDRRQNRLDAARAQLQAVIAREPSNVDAMILLAEIEKSAGNRAAAIAAYRAVLAVESSHLVALNNLSLELALDSPEEALGLAQQALQLAPENAAVQDTLGWIYYRRGNYRTATQYLKGAVAMDPNPRRQFHLALSYIKLGERGLGEDLLRTALRRDPSLKATVQEW